MLKYIYIIAIIASLLFAITACKGPEGDAGPIGPTGPAGPSLAINTLSAEPAIAAAGDTVDLLASIVYHGSRTLSYRWLSTSGTVLSPTSLSTRWVAPLQGLPYGRLTFTVSDSADSARGFLSIPITGIQPPVSEWVKLPDPVIPTYCYTPWVILDNGTYRMWYCGGSIVDEDLFYCESTDGMNWGTPQIALSRTGYQFGRACVIKEGNTYKMWYGGDGSVTYYTSSSDPHSFPVGVTVSGLSYLATIVRNGSQYWGWASQGNSVYRATSTDGLTWSMDNSPALTPGASGAWDSDDVSPGFVLHTDQWYMFYIGDHGFENDRIGWATSSDGLQWTRQPNNPIVGPGVSGTWDSHQVSLGGVVQSGNQFQMWYTGNRGSGGSGNAIGYAYSVQTVF